MTTLIPEEQTEKTPATAKKKAGVAKRRAHVAAAKAKPPRKAPPSKKAATARHGSKTAKILDLLKRPGGVTLKELMKATDWQAHSVRAALTGLRKEGKDLVRAKDAGGVTHYRLASQA